MTYYRTPWRTWFAWRPVRTIDRRIAWLRPIQRCTYSYEAPGMKIQTWVSYRVKGTTWTVTHRVTG